MDRLAAQLRRHADLAWAGGVALVLVAEILAFGTHVGALLAVVPLVAFAIGVRRRAPLVAAAAVVGAWLLSDRIDPDFNAEGGVAWLLSWLVVHFSLGRWTTGGIAAIAPLVPLVTAVLLGRDDIFASGFSTSDLAYFVSVSVAPWAVGLFVRLRQQHVARLREENERLEREQAEAARRAVAEERSRIARELHDVVSHAISVTVLQSRGARRKLGRDEQSVREALDAIEQTNAAALSDMRRLLAVLRDTEGTDDPAELHQPLPSLARLDLLVDEVRASGLEVDVTREGVQVDIPPGVDLSAYRIVQEALTNVLRHAGSGARAAVGLAFGTDDLRVTVLSSGGDPATATGGGAGHGLVGIRERVAVVGGDVTAGPGQDGGFEVRARLPYALESA